MNNFDKDLYKKIIKDIPKEAFSFFRENIYFHGFKVSYNKDVGGFLREYFTSDPLMSFSDENINKEFKIFLTDMNIFYNFTTIHSIDTGHSNLDFRKNNHPKTGGRWHDLKEEQEIEKLGKKMLNSYNDFILSIKKPKNLEITVEKKTVSNSIQEINISDITIKIIDREKAQIYLKNSKKHEITKEKIATNKQAWTLLNLLSMENMLNANTNITLDTLIKNFALSNSDNEKNRNTIQRHKSELNKKLKNFLLKYYTWNNLEAEIIYYHKPTNSYKTKFTLEPTKEYRKKLWHQSRGFDEESLSYRTDN